MLIFFILDIFSLLSLSLSLVLSINSDRYTIRKVYLSVVYLQVPATVTAKVTNQNARIGLLIWMITTWVTSKDGLVIEQNKDTG